MKGNQFTSQNLPQNKSAAMNYTQELTLNRGNKLSSSDTPFNVIHCHVCLLGKFLVVKHTATQELTWIEVEMWDIYYDEADDVFTNQHSMMAEGQQHCSGFVNGEYG